MGMILSIRGFRDTGKEHGNYCTIVYWGYMGIMEQKMETTRVYWGYMGIMETKMETTNLHARHSLPYANKNVAKRSLT